MNETRFVKSDAGKVKRDQRLTGLRCATTWQATDN